MKKIIITESQLKRLINESYMEKEDNSITFEDIQSLKKINNQINKQEVINWANQNDLDYYGMTDLELYANFLENNINQNDEENFSN